jgi:hypothetical protein
MTINIRNSVFETNSSSSHSVTLQFSDSNDLCDTIPLNEKGQIVLDGGDFSYTEMLIEGALCKANFIAVYMTVYGNEALKKRFEKILKEQTGASEIIYNIRMTYLNGEPANSFFSSEYGDPYGYYDGDEILLEDIVKNGKKLRKFIFNPSVKIESEIGYS